MLDEQTKNLKTKVMKTTFLNPSRMLQAVLAWYSSYSPDLEGLWSVFASGP